MTDNFKASIKFSNQEYEHCVFCLQTCNTVELLKNMTLQVSQFYDSQTGREYKHTVETNQTNTGSVVSYPNELTIIIIHWLCF